MLAEFVIANRAALVDHARQRVAARLTPQPTHTELVHGVPLFIDQLAVRLGADLRTDHGAFEASATLHGGELWHAGFSIGQVVHDYGDICQAITELAAKLGVQISSEDFRKLNMCLDIAIAEAVTEYARQHEQTILGQGIQQLGFLAHELRNLLNAATLAFDAVRTGSVGIDGSTGKLLGTSLAAMGDLVTRSLAEVRLEAGQIRVGSIEVSRLFEEVEVATTLQAKMRGVQMVIVPADPPAAVEGDLQILTSIVTNLVQNACKFGRAHGRVTLRALSSEGRVIIEVEDECGGLPPGRAETLFRPFEQRGNDRSGLGLGLAISLKAAHALGGDLHVRNLPGKGCVFSVDLRRSTS